MLAVQFLFPPLLEHASMRELSARCFDDGSLS